MSLQTSAFECAICYTTYTKPTKRCIRLECDTCHYVVCRKCQTQYAKVECPNCHNTFTRDQIQSVLGVAFVQRVIIQEKINELMIIQKQLIPETGALIDYFKMLQYVKQERMYGKTMELPQRPIIISAVSTTNYPCALANCRGYIKPNPINRVGNCCLCKSSHCNSCFVHVSNDEEHICDPSLLSSLVEIERSTKRCPTCYVRIHRTHGCNHMNCAACNTHFDWITGVQIASSYQPNTPVDQKRGTMNLIATPGDIRTDELGYNIRLKFNHCCKKAVQARLSAYGASEREIHVLFIIPHHVSIFLAKTETSPQKYNEIMDDLRVQFMTNKISERTWGNRVYFKYRNHQMDLNIQSILNKFVSAVSRLPGYETVFKPTQKNTHINKPLEDWSVMAQMVETLIAEANRELGRIHDDFYELRTTVEQFYIDPTYYRDASTEIPIFTKRFSDIPEIVTNCTVHSSSNKVDNPISADAISPVEDQRLEQVQLLDYQHEHYANLIRILTDHDFVLDHSPMGAGKTFTFTKYVQTHDFDVIIIVCPAGLRPRWIEIQKKYNVKAMVLSYTNLGGVRGIQPNHGLLARYDYTSHSNLGRITSHTQYTGTPEFIRMLREKRVCFAFDEIQALRNNSSNVTMAARKLIMLARGSNTNNGTSHRIFYLSGTPFDTKSNATTFLRTSGIITKPLIEECSKTHIITRPGLIEATTFFRSLVSEEEANTTLSRLFNQTMVTRTTSQAQNKIYELFKKCVIPTCSTAMIPSDGDSKSSICIHKVNTFCRLQGSSANLYLKVRNQSMDIIQQFENEEITLNQEQRARVFETIMMLETCLIDTVVHLATQALKNNPNAKVVIAATYTNTIQKINAAMQSYAPFVLDGSIDADMRHVLVQAFQVPDTINRLIIGNLMVVSTGIDLDDRDGRFPRHVFVFPTFHMMNAHQFNFRFLRGNTTQSSTTVRYVYSDTDCTDEDKARAECTPEMYIPIQQTDDPDPILSDNDPDSDADEDTKLPRRARTINTRTTIEQKLFAVVAKKSKIINAFDVDSRRMHERNEIIYVPPLP